MRAVASTAWLALTLFAALPTLSRSQDSAGVRTRHLLSLDTSRVRPYHRAFDILVLGRDSATLIGQRDVALTSATYAGNAVWLMVENRSGVVSSVESLYVAPAMTAVHWSSSLGGARLALEFVGDSIFGATSFPRGRRNVVLQGRPDLIASTAMIEALLPLMPLAANWTDSVGVLSVTLDTSAVIPAELSVIGEEQLAIDSLGPRAVWIVALRAERGNVLFWVEKSDGAVFRVQQPLPSHIGTLLEYRWKPEAVGHLPPPPQ